MHPVLTATLPRSASLLVHPPLPVPLFRQALLPRHRLPAVYEAHRQCPYVPLLRKCLIADPHLRLLSSSFPTLLTPPLGSQQTVSQSSNRLVSMSSHVSLASSSSQRIQRGQLLIMDNNDEKYFVKIKLNSRGGCMPTTDRSKSLLVKNATGHSRQLYLDVSKRAECQSSESLANSANTELFVRSCYTWDSMVHRTG